MNVSRNLAMNLKSLRAKRDYSQERLGQIAKVPRSTIANAESGVGNPSLSNLVKLADALQINVDELLSKPRTDCIHYQKTDIPTEFRAQGKCAIQKLLPDAIPGMEIDRVQMKARTRQKGIPHLQGTKEYLFVLKGVIDVHITEQKFTISKGELLAFPGDQYHSYYNPLQAESVYISVVALAR